MAINLRALLILAFSAASLGLAACNTTAGVGKDIQATGDAIEDTADDTKTEIQN